ncbi:hypothetical protein BACUNI_02478 [Bacteroides uniformis ATCC 8492]|uniref:Uncharacterized protein n=1 Tax=Bacteroides uniformis (strain ATCC 8492 / DSM 6597 / CCUG 4942 / CIP 103695 / JCM 5828 / KCTC 5204 / NCTC 13054 / VPI 0061) TaxID=411479 RepID=A0ABC9NAS6_BACUC|nr:hypothetical protein BACUNI_02478 [Bacteroides uniformis ATCC 8492]
MIFTLSVAEFFGLSQYCGRFHSLFFYLWSISFRSLWIVSF